MTKKEMLVSVSLWSYIHSYLALNEFMTTRFKEVCFCLLTEYHSFLYKVAVMLTRLELACKFPSPCGVSFILTLEHQKDDGLF